MNATKRIRIALIVVIATTLIGSNFAKAEPVPDPLSDLQRMLFPVTDVRATGYGPGKVLVSWTDHSAVETGFRIEMAINAEDGLYETVATAGKCDNGGISPGANGAIAVPKICNATVDLSRNANLAPADPRPLFFRVVSFIELANDPTKPSTPGSGTPLLEGRPSPVDPALLGPFAPTDLICNGGGIDACTNVTSVTLTWTDNSDESYFWIYRAPGAINPNFGSAPYAATSQDATTYHEDLLDYGAIYTYKVTAVRERNIQRLDGTIGVGDGEPERSYTDSAEVPTGATANEPPVVIVVPVAPVPAPSDPSGLTAVFVEPGTDTKCPTTLQGCTRLTWVDASAPGAQYVDEDGWFIEIARASDIGFRSQWTSPGTLGPGARTFYDKSMTPDTVRCYRIRAWREGPAYSRFTNAVCLGALPKAPSGLVATAVSNALVNLKWKDNSTTEEAFVIERCEGVCTSVSSWTVINNAVPINDETAVDNTTVEKTTYSYRVRARNSTGRSAPSNISVTMTLPAPVKAPEHLTATGRVHAIALSWIDMAANETGYRIEYRAASSCTRPFGEWKKLTDLPANQQGYLDTDGLSVKQSRFYRVRATKGTGVSDPTNEACATTLDKSLPNGAPTDVTATTQSNTSIVLRWNDTATNETAFAIEYALAPNKHCTETNALANPFKLYGKVQPLDTEHRPFDQGLPGPRSWTIVGLVPHSAYFFRVKAVNPDGESDWGLRDGAVSTSTDPADRVSACSVGNGQTYGPPKPVFVDPNTDNQINATRCDFTIQAPRVEVDANGAATATPHHDRVGGMRVDVISTVPGSSIAHRDTLFVVANGGTVPGAVNKPDSNSYIYTESNPKAPEQEFTFGGANAPNNWTMPYAFRHGVNYKILVSSYLQDGVEVAGKTVYWSSQQAHVTDVKVAADCPLPGLVGNKP